MIKLIISDMDGTLLNSKHELHPDFWQIEEALHLQGIMFAVASGRQYYNLESKFERLKDRMLFIAENGTVVMHKGEELHIDHLDRKSALEFIEIGRNLENTNLVVCGKSCAYIETRDESFISEIKNYYHRLEIVDDLTKVDDTILKVTLSNFNGVEEHTYSHFSAFNDTFKVAIAAKVFLDITAKTANKGTAIQNVQKRLNISPDETLVFGDYLNDLEMMQNAKYSYAMKNAHPEILKISSHITQFDNNNNGVLKTIEELNILKDFKLKAV